MQTLLNTYLGQYYLTEIIGRGSTSVVYKAFQSALNRYVAVKVLASGVDPQFAARFKREAHAVAQLQHPNILPIYDYGEDRGQRFFVTQYIEGNRTLEQALADAPIEPLAALRLMLPLLSALKYAHERGIVHRDIKPANIMLPRPDWPLLADFGIAKLIDDSQQLTPPGQSVGTAIYMAPERAHSTAADTRGDLYSLGVVLYEMLTGRVPFDGASPVEVLRKHVREPISPPRSVNPNLPAAVEPVLLRALEKDPARRYQSADEMARAVERLIGQTERQRAQQHPEMLQQPADGGTGMNPYETRELTETSLANVRQRNNRLSAALLAIALLLALGGIVMARGGTGLASGPPATPAAGGSAAPATAAAASAQTQAPASPPLPAATVAATSLATTAAPTSAPAPTVAPPQVSQSGGATAIRLEDTTWQGGYRPAGGRTYGGRTATWIYGTSTEYSTMRASFDVASRPAGTATLTVEGMDSEDRTKTPISIKINGVEIYAGDNPLPNDDQPLESGTWASYSWSFDAALLRPGRNEVSISNLAPGAFSLPPFFMLDYAKISYSLQK